MRTKKNEVSQKIHKTNGEEKLLLIKTAKSIKSELAIIEPEFEGIEKDYNDLMLRVPGVPIDAVPPGNSDDDNIEIVPRYSLKNYPRV